MPVKPRIEDAPGLIWRVRTDGTIVARWAARADLVRRGYPISTVALWEGQMPGVADVAMIQQRCQEMQRELLIWARGGVPVVLAYDGTLDGLIACYKADEDSPYRRLRYGSRVSYDKRMGQISRDFGGTPIKDMTGRALRAMHRHWYGDGKVTGASSLIQMVRGLISFGVSILECSDCERVAGILHVLRFESPKPRLSILTAEHAIAIRAEAHKMGRPSIALAQALQFELALRQKDIIGEWVPTSEPGTSDVLGEDRQGRPIKWMRGIDWREIDGNLILRHVTSKKQKPIEVDLRSAPMVMEELGKLGAMPASGPVIVSEVTGRAYLKELFYREWRAAADAAGVPRGVWNMDSRSGAITEATNSGADLEKVRHMATHSDVKMTQRYSRDAANKTAEVMQSRIAYRNKGGTK